MKCVLYICTLQVHTHLEQWAANAAAPGSSWGFGALLKGLTSVVDNPAGAEIPTHNLGLQVRRSIH